MKKIITLATASLLTLSGAYAQTVYDAAKIAGKDLSGTARFVGMGGAMGALGGDVSTMGTNPAGIGIYRSNDYTATVNFFSTEAKSEYNGATLKPSADRFNLNNIGVVFSSKISDYTALRYVNFGFTYNRSKMFNKNMEMKGSLGSGSNADGTFYYTQTYQMATQANGLDPKFMDYEDVYWNDPEVGWLSALGYQRGLIVPNQDEEGNYFYTTLGLSSSPHADFFSREKGYVDEYNFNVSFNFNDRVYLGATIGAYDVDYTKYSYYKESFSTADIKGYSLESWNNIYGSGVDFKLGAIVRPLEYSPLRLGFAVHTPTFYRLTLATSAYMAVGQKSVDTYSLLGGDMHYKYRLRTPWKFNTSLGYTVGSDLALGAEYEYQKYSSMKFYNEDDVAMGWENRTAKDMLKGVHTLRLGAEYKIIPEFSVRAGYNYTTTAFDKGAWKVLALNSINTDTDFANTKSLSNYTLGMGYRGDNFYADIAYKYSKYKEDFYPFADEDFWNAAKVSNDSHQVFLTVGFRF